MPESESRTVTGASERMRAPALLLSSLCCCARAAAAAASSTSGPPPAVLPAVPAWSLFGNTTTAPGDRAGFYTAETIQHWPAGRVVRNVSHPSLQPFLADPAHPNNDGTAVIIAPGGAYKWLTWDAEGVDIAAWLNSIGISAFVLKYRVPFRPWLCRPGYGCRSGEAPLIDAQRAVGLLRSRAPVQRPAICYESCHHVPSFIDDS